MKFEQPQPLSESPDTEHDPDYEAKLKREAEERHKASVMRLGKRIPLDVDVNVEEPELEDRDRPSGVRGEPMVPPIESGPQTVRSGEGPDQYGVESVPDQDELDIPISVEKPESGVQYIGGEISGKGMEEVAREEAAFAKDEKLPPYGQTVLEGAEEEEEEHRKAA